MKRNFLAATACLFLCAAAIVLFAGHTFKVRSSVPTFSERAIEQNADMPKIKNLLPHFKHRPHNYAP
ncbi:MAG: hypothetical protein IJ514_06235 [Clostridia bacterium]|nr:hypothetical protein [Clostridia bacterium]